MKNITVTVLGTGTSQGVPVIGCDCSVCTSPDPRDQRLRTSIIISSQHTRIGIDVGPDFRQQLLRAGIDNLDAILITHEHNDHISGLDDVRPINFKYGKSINLYGMPRVLNDIKHRFAYVFDEQYRYPGKPKLELHEMPEVLEIGDLTVLPVEIIHGTLPILGFRCGNFCYLTDVKTIDDAQFEKLQGIEVLIINALHHRTHSSHLNLDEALAMIARINPGEAYLTHISHYMGLHAEVEPKLPSDVYLAYDGLELNI